MEPCSRNYESYQSARKKAIKPEPRDKVAGLRREKGLERAVPKPSDESNEPFGVFVERLDGCWISDTKHKKHFSNALTLCFSNDSARLKIGFENKGSARPTECVQKGSIRDRNGNRFRISFSVGSCKNGNSLRAADESCVLYEDALHCTDKQKGIELVYQRRSW